MHPSVVCSRSNKRQTGEKTARSSQKSAQVSLSASNSNTTDPSIPEAASSTTTLPSNTSAGILMPTPSVSPVNVTTGTSTPGTTSNASAVPSNASAGIPIPSNASTPAALPTNASTGACIPGTASTATTALSNSSTGIPIPSCASAQSVMPTNATAGTSLPTAVPVGVAAAISPASRQLAFNELPQEEINRHLNIYAVQVLIPKVLCKILEWGCLKNQTDTFYKYLNDTKKLSDKQLKTIYNISEDDLNKLMHADPSHMDAPLLRKVIQAACEKLEEKKDGVWKENDETQIECLIGMLTECRNKVCHEILFPATSSKMFSEIIRLLKKLIEVGANLYQRLPTEKNETLKQLQDNIGIVTTTKYERDVTAVQNLFHTSGYLETQSYWTKYCAQDIHLYSNVPSTHADVFYPLDVLQKSSDTHNMPMSYEKMLDGPVVDDKRHVLILIGEAGSGKSTILKQIAMQFFKLTKYRMPSLEAFHLLHFFKCNNTKFKDLAYFIENSFPKTCRALSTEHALKCFKYLKSLIFIDGYDEVNPNSVEVTKQFVETCKTNPACQIVFTARPCAVPDLTAFLKKEGVQFNIFQLLEISQVEKQLEFLNRLDPNSALCEAFSALSADVKSFFVLPINLVQFCSLFLLSPDEVRNWKSTTDVMRDIMSQYETLIIFKLEQYGIPNLKRFINQVLRRLCDIAFEGLIKREFILDERACTTLSDDCCEIIEKWDCIGRVDANQILSVVYVTKVTPSKDALPAYQYSHISMQELMSARSLLSELTLQQTQTLEQLIRTRIRYINERDGVSLTYEAVNEGLLNVYKFVLMILSDPKKRRLLQRWIPELKTALTAARADWQDVMMSCDRPAETEQDEVAKIAAKQKLAASSKWKASTARNVMAIARMLPHTQPNELHIKLPKSEGTPLELAAILKMFNGHLSLNIHHPHETYTNCERIVDELNSSSCSVTSFTGCLASSSVSTRSLSEKIHQPDARLDLALEDPSLHTLQELQGTKHILNVRIKHHNPTTARPLPRGFMPPLLIVEGTPDSGAEELRAAIVHYAPEGGVYFSLWLENTLLDDAAIQWLLKVLEEDNIRTCYHRGETCFTVACKTSDGLCLNCRKAHADASQRCVWVQLANKWKEEGEEVNKGEFCYADAIQLGMEHQVADGGKEEGEEVRSRQCDFKSSKELKKDGDHENLNLLCFDDLAKVNCHRGISSIVRDIMRGVICWGCKKPKCVTFLKYISERNSEVECKFSEIERRMLNETELDNRIDVDLLYRLIPLVCENLGCVKIQPEKKKKSSRVKDLMESIMKARNDIVNLPAKANTYLGDLKKFEGLCTELISAAHQLYKIGWDSPFKVKSATLYRFTKVGSWQEAFKAATAFKKDGNQDDFSSLRSDELTKVCCRRVIYLILPDIIRRVMDWGCRKPEYMTFLDYMLRIDADDSNDFRYILNVSVFDDTVDYPLFHFLIPLVRENLGYKENFHRKEVERLLERIRNITHVFSQCTVKAAAYKTLLCIFEDLCTKLIIATGKLSSIDMGSVEEEVTTTRCKFFKVMDDCFMRQPAARHQFFGTDA